MKNLLFSLRPILTDMASTILFAALFGLTNDIYLSTGAAISMGLGQVVFERLRGRSVPGMQWASLGLVVVLGGVTLFTGDPRFVMVKPTIIYVTVGVAMLQPGWMDRYIPPAAHEHLPKRMFTVWGYVWSGLMFATALANLIFAVWFGHKAWAAFIGVFPIASKLALFAIQYASLRTVALRRRRAAAPTPESAPQMA